MNGGKEMKKEREEEEEEAKGIGLVRERKRQREIVLGYENGTLTMVPRIYAVKDFEFDTSHLYRQKLHQTSLI